jgi:hypothetical protein
MPFYDHLLYALLQWVDQPSDQLLTKSIEALGVDGAYTSGFGGYAHVEVPQQPCERERRESTVSSRRVGNGDIQILTDGHESIDVDEIAQLRPLQQCTELLCQDRTRGVDENLRSSQGVGLDRINGVHRL